jgi:hypothetical protein
MGANRSRVIRLASIVGLVASVLAFVYLCYRETAIWPRASPVRTAQNPEYVHERFQRSYYSARDAQALRTIHDEQAAALLAVIGCYIAVLRARRRPAADDEARRQRER